MNLFPQFDAIKRPFLLFLGCTMIGIIVFVIGSGAYVIETMYSSGTLLSNSFDFSSYFSKLTINQLLIIQVIQMIAFFIIPPYLYSLFTKRNFGQLFRIDQLFDWKIILYGIGFSLFIFPLLIYIQDIITQIPWPEGIRSMAVMQKEAAEQIQHLFWILHPSADCFSCY